MVHTVILYLERKIFYELVLCILNKILNVLFTMEIIFFFSKFRSYRILDFMQKILLKIYFIDNNENFVRKSGSKLDFWAILQEKSALSRRF